MRRWLLLTATLLGFWPGMSTAFGQAGQPPSSPFRQLGALIDEFRRGGDMVLQLRVRGDTFSILKEEASPIPEESAKALLAQSKEQIPSLRLTPTGEVIVLRIDEDNTLEFEPREERGGAESSGSWRKRGLASVGSYPIGKWPDFVAFAIENGLTGYYEWRSAGAARFSEMRFAALGPETVRSGGYSLNLTSRFYRFMRVSPTHKPFAGSNGFVVLIHDPHSSVAGRFDLVPGLKALLDANQERRFRFLIEGEYYGQSREIDYGSLPAALKAAPVGASRNALVYQLLRKFLVDTPLAYRLLYVGEPASLPATAIDDNTLLERAPALVPGRDRRELDAVIGIAQAVSKIPWKDDATRRAIEEKVGIAAMMTIAYVRADLSQMSSDQLPRHYSAIAKQFKTLADLGARLADAGQASGLSTHASFLRTQRTAYLSQADQYQRALARNTKMLEFIVPAAKNGRAVLPLAFIGNYHTEGITRGLRSEEIGYIVIEPRPREAVGDPEREHTDFQKAIHSLTAEAYLQRLLMNKGFVKPRESYVSRFYFPYLQRQGAEIKTAYERSLRDYRVLAAPELRFNELVSAMSDNGSLSGLAIGYGRNKPPPPGKFAGAFAFYDGSGGRPELVILDPSDRRWQENDRYDFIRSGRFGLPPAEGAITSALAITYYRDARTGRTFSTFYDRQSKRIYCFESTPAQLASLAPLPVGSEKTGYDVRLQLSEIRAKNAHRRHHG